MQKHIRLLRRRGSVLLLVLSVTLYACAVGSDEGVMHSSSCPADLKGNYVCGPTNAEDLLHLEGTPWVLASQYSAPYVERGAITAIHQKTREWTELPVSGHAGNHEVESYPNCPGPVSAEGFRGHGMAVRPSEPGKALLYAVNHGAREAVEVFDVTYGGESLPKIRCIGCIPSPDGDSLNTLTTLPDGGLVATKYHELENTDWASDMFSKKTTGQVFEWHRSKGWASVPRSYMSGPNGVVVIENGESLIVAEWGGKRLHKLRRDGTRAPVIVELAGYPDNLHIAKDGKILVTMQTEPNMAAISACMATNQPVCGGLYEVFTIDGETLQTTAPVAMDPPDLAAFGFGTGALDLGNELWIGTVRGDKVRVVTK